MSRRVVLVDHGRGNLRSVINALEHLDFDVHVATTAAEIIDAGPVILPGVGAFAEAMRGLVARGFDEALREHAAQGRPLLGICLGMQLLLDLSAEFGETRGLSLIPGTVESLDHAAGRVPHVGWSRITPSSGEWSGSPLARVSSGSWMYFVHSFEARPIDPSHIVAVCEHGGQPVTAAVQNQLVFGVQFHPEKSGAAGLSILQTFCGDT